jgi:endonuclease-3 related protein
MGMYSRLYNAFGPQRWWPGDTPLEVAVGAVLTQNTNWENVEKAIRNLKRAKALSARAIHRMPEMRLAELIRPSGYFNIKARRLKEFVEFLMGRYGGSMARMGREETGVLRKRLLGVKGIGPETADSILLYALEKPVFVIDAYTKRILSRHGFMAYDEPYERFQEFFQFSLEADTALFNEYHALLVRAGKIFCRPSKPLCNACPLKGV